MLDFLAGQMINAETQWSLGTFGAIAELMRDLDEPFTFPQMCGSAKDARPRSIEP